MNLPFTATQFLIKRKGISTGKFRIVSPQDELLFYVEVKTQFKAPNTIIRFYNNEKKEQELLLAQDGKHGEYADFLEVTDLSTGQLVGGIGVGADFFKDAWDIMDAQNRIVCNLGDTSTKRAILHDLTDGLLSQKLDFKIEAESIGELRQKKTFFGTQLKVDFSQDTANRLDHRLGLAVAVVVAVHQARTETD